MYALLREQHFVSYYGGTAEWDAAPQELPHSSTGDVPPPAIDSAVNPMHARSSSSGRTRGLSTDGTTVRAGRSREV